MALFRCGAGSNVNIDDLKISYPTQSSNSISGLTVGDVVTCMTSSSTLQTPTGATVLDSSTSGSGNYCYLLKATDTTINILNLSVAIKLSI